MLESNFATSLNLKERKSMLDFDALCPHCEKKFKLSIVGLETKQFIQCPHCRKIIKLDLADPEKKAIRIGLDFID
jgi:DNA-directed RNA polymerase subunit RPC12/RpoP